MAARFLNKGALPRACRSHDSKYHSLFDDLIQSWLGRVFSWQCHTDNRCCVTLYGKYSSICRSKSSSNSIRILSNKHLCLIWSEWLQVRKQVTLYCLRGKPCKPSKPRGAQIHVEHVQYEPLSMSTHVLYSTAHTYPVGTCTCTDIQ